MSLRLSGLATGALLCALAAGIVPAAAAPAEVTSVVHVETSRVAYLDGSQRGLFTLTGLPCVASGGAIQVDRGRCPAESPTIEGSIANAVLGFSAGRQADAAPAEVPVLDSGSATAENLALRINLDVVTAGNVTVTAIATETDTVAPRFVAGSASNAGELTGDRVVWRLGDIQPGAQTLTVGVEPNAKEGFAGTYLPEIVIDRTAADAPLLPSLRPEGPSTPARSAIARLRMTQRVAPPAGAPQLQIEDMYRTSAASDAAGSWSAQMTADMFGSWAAGTDPPAEQARTMPFSALGVAPDGRCGGTTVSYVRPTLHGSVTASVGTPPFSSDVRDEFRFRVATNAAAGVEGPAKAADAEAMTVGAILDLERSGGGTDEVPVDDAGTPTLLWDGTYGDASWVDQTRVTDATEVGAGNIIPLGFSNTGRTTTGLLTHASLTFEAVDGDIDNRTSEQPRIGPTVTLRPPPGFGVAAMTTLTGYCAKGGYSTNIGLQREDATPLSAVVAGTVTPTIEPGGYWIGSDGAGAQRTWQASTDVVLQAYRRGSPAPGAEVEHVVTVPAGGIEVIEHRTPTASVSTTLRAGTWSVLTSGDRLTVRPLPDRASR